MVSITRWTVLGLLFAAAAVAVTWPFAASLGEGIPLGTERVATVPLFNLWTMSWNVRSIERGFANYWQAPIFHPARDAFAFSEPQPVLGLLAFVLCQLGASTVMAYGLLLLGALAVNGLLATTLLRWVGLGWLSSIFGGVLVLMLPFTHQELGVLQLVPLGGILIFALGVMSFAESPGLRSGLMLGTGLALAYGLSSQVAVFGALSALPAALWLWWPHRRRRRAWASLAAGVTLFFLLVSPLLVVQVRATAGEGFERSAETVRKHSAQPRHYLRSPWPQLVPTPGIQAVEGSSTRAFWPGTTRVLLAALGLVAALRSARWRRLAVAGLLVLTTSVMLSLGGYLAFGGVSLPDLLRPLPGLGQIRSFFRFALFSQLMIALLAGGAIYGLLETIRRRLRAESRLRQAVAQGMVTALAVLAALEMPTQVAAIEPLPALDDLPWLVWIENNTAPQDVLAFLPFPKGRSAGDYLGTAQWMFWQQGHWRPMVNGYSGFFPNRFKEIKKEMESFPSAASLRALRTADVRYCVVPRAVIEASPPPDPNGQIRLEIVFRDEQHEIAIFELSD